MNIKLQSQNTEKFNQENIYSYSDVTLTPHDEFWISYQWLILLRKASHWQLIQNLAPSTIVWRQCDIRMAMIFAVQRLAPLCTTNTVTARQHHSKKSSSVCAKLLNQPLRRYYRVMVFNMILLKKSFLRLQAIRWRSSKPLKYDKFFFFASLYQKI